MFLLFVSAAIAYLLIGGVVIGILAQINRELRQDIRSKAFAIGSLSDLLSLYGRYS
jgi:hypothetical protein